MENGLKSISYGADILVAGYFSVFKKDGDIKSNYADFIKDLDRAAANAAKI